MQNQQPLQNCHIILRLCEVEQGESLHTHKAFQKSVEEMHRSEGTKELMTLAKIKTAQVSIIQAPTSQETLNLGIK